ncbi:MAG TPA: bacteriochlorophyll 4-vinyl reductase [Burkholderiales bacterium]|nr:bacteriochlorophyll 4-vinyl reductase [Betaproteobacteria bacterium]HQR52136.1 bacteriochlorophyll 4-vinyl reductase [Burkholderiales bacterium]
MVVVASEHRIREKRIGRIGPNAITRVADALRLQVGQGGTARLFRSAGIERYLVSPPRQMVDEREVKHLHRVLRAELGLERARWVARAAGFATGDYLLSERIPRVVQFVMRALPSRVASRLLLAALRRHAWTFSGSSVFAARTGRPLHIWISSCLVCCGSIAHEPLCDYYAATFQRLFRGLVDPGAVVRETECEAMGADACLFEVKW